MLLIEEDVLNLFDSKRHLSEKAIKVLNSRWFITERIFITPDFDIKGLGYDLYTKQYLVYSSLLTNDFLPLKCNLRKYPFQKIESRESRVNKESKITMPYI